MSAPTTTQELDLAITGMTCASCAARIEKKVGRLEGVEISVNLATDKAHVRYAAPASEAEILAELAKTGYGATVIRPSATRGHAVHHGGRPGAHRRDQGHTDHPDANHLNANHLEHDVAPADVLRRRAIVAGALTLPVLLLAMVPWLNVPAEPWVQLVFATPVAIWAAWPFHRAMAINARHKASTMDTLVSVGVLAAYGWSLVAVVTGRAGDGMGMDEGAHLYFETAAVVTTFLLVGRWLEARAKHAGKSALEALLALGAKDVAVQRLDPTTRAVREVRIPIDDLAVGDTFVVRPGEKVATDGVVVDGSSAVDTSLLTGESMPVDVGPGERVVGGTVNAHGRLLVRATAVGAETTLAGVTRLVEQAQTGKAPVQRLADRISAVFVPIVLGLALLTFLGWWIGTGEASRALEVAIAVLIIACPCALGLATPTALLVGSGRGAELGVLIKGPHILEDTRRVDTLVLDKTGTVTSGAMRLTDVRPVGRLDPVAALRAAAAVESGSEHPLARAITTAAAERGLDVPAIADFRALTGSGAQARINGMLVTVGRTDLFDTVPGELTPQTPTPSARPGTSNAGRPGTTVYVGWDGTARAALTIADDVRATSAQAIREVQRLGLTPYLLTGDNATAANSVGRAVGIPADRVLADVRPEEKHAVVRRLQAEGHVVAMVGDGVNDAAALAQADLGIAMGSGTDVAMESADIVLMRPDLLAVGQAIGLSRATLRTIKQNLAWAFGYNTAAIPLAVAGLLNPMIAGAAMALSSVLVVANSLRLRRFGR